MEILYGTQIGKLIYHYYYSYKDKKHVFQHIELYNEAFSIGQSDSKQRKTSVDKIDQIEKTTKPTTS